MANISQDMVLKASYLESHMRELENNISFIDTQVTELSQFLLTVDSLITSKNKEILSSLGKGVYLESEIKNKSLLVEVGAGVVIRKTPEETKNILNEQIKRFKEAKMHFMNELQETSNALSEMISEIENSQK